MSKISDFVIGCIVVVIVLFLIQKIFGKESTRLMSDSTLNSFLSGKIFYISVFIFSSFLILKKLYIENMEFIVQSNIYFNVILVFVLLLFIELDIKSPKNRVRSFIILLIHLLLAFNIFVS